MVNLFASEAKKTMRDYNSAVSDLMLSLVQGAIPQGPADMRALSTALREYADKVEATRDTLVTTETMRCTDCGRYWSVSVTVKTAREMSCPDNCPECFNASKKAQGSDLRSKWTVCYRYLSPAEVALEYGDG
jgi:hypothetical protein